MLFALGDFCDETLDAVDLCDVCGDGDALAAVVCHEALRCFIACLCLTSRDVHLGAVGQKSRCDHLANAS